MSTVVANEETKNQSNRAQLEDVDHDGRPSFVLTFPEVKLLGIAGVSLLPVHHSIVC